MRAATTRHAKAPAATAKGLAQDCGCDGIAMDDGLKGRRAAAWVHMWDRGKRCTRRRILETFLRLHSSSSSDAVTQDLGDAAPLFFARITSWLRLSYCKLQSLPGAAAVGHSSGTQPTPRRAGASQGGRGSFTRTGAAATATAAAAATEVSPASPVTAASSTLLMVQSLAVFVRSATYVTQLVESGVAATLTDCLERGAAAKDEAAFQPLTLEERTAILLLLLYVANAGRVYREMICDEEGLLSLLHVMRVETDESVAALLTELFVLLGKGNPRLAPLVQCGLFRLVMRHYDADADERADADDPLPAEEPQRAAASSGGEAKAHEKDGGGAAARGQSSRDDAVVVLQAARALRGLQLHKETHHYSSCGRPQRQAGVAGAGTWGGRHSRGEGRAGRDDGWEVGDTTVSGVPEVDRMPVVCCFSDCVPSAVFGSGSEEARRFTAYTRSSLFQPISVNEFVDALFSLTLDADTRFRVEGSELLVMAAKNAELMPKILNRALDVLDDDMLVIADAEDAVAVARRQRRQVSCGRVAVQIVLTTPATPYRRRAVVDLIALRSAHMSLLKYLRLTDLGDTATVVDCCHALQLIARASEEEQRSHLQQQQYQLGQERQASAVTSVKVADTRGGGSRSVRGGNASTVSAVARMGHVICDALGHSLYQVLLHEEMTEDESFAMLRAARSSATAMAAW